MSESFRALLAGLRRQLLPQGTRRQARYHALRQRWTRWYLGPPAANEGPPPSRAFEGADLSVVVIALDAQPELVDAVRSLVAQVPAPEIIVVNSGRPGAAVLLAAARLDVTVIESSCRLFAGAARNVGIAASHGPFVAFLAADCLAHPGWVAARLESHHAGADLVSSPVVNAHPANLFSVAAHVLLFAARFPGTPQSQRHHYGASYRRTLFSAHGTFSAELRAGEDTEFHQRLPRIVKRTFDARVRTAHRNPRTPWALLEDQYARGRRRALASQTLGTPLTPAEIPRMGSARSRRLLRLALEATPGAEWPRLLLSTPWIWIAGLAYQRGIRSVAPALSPSSESATPRSPLRLIALLQFRNDDAYLAGYLANLAGQVDGLLVLDDGSASPVDAQKLEGGNLILEVLRIAPRSPHVWDERRNQRLLLDCARRHRGQWLLALDTDERLERDFRTRADACIDAGDRDGIRAYSVVLRELWDSPVQYRVDGIWGTKRRPRLFRTRDDHEQSLTQIHAHWAPLNDRRAKGGFATADLILYHLAMITPAQREARKMKYKVLDPDNASQAIGYDYLTDETGLVLESLPEGRDYRPV